MEFNAIRLYIDEDEWMYGEINAERDRIEFVLDGTHGEKLSEYICCDRIKYSKFGDNELVFCPEDYKEFVQCLRETKIDERLDDVPVFQIDEICDNAGIFERFEMNYVCPGYACESAIEYAMDALMDSTVSEDDAESVRDAFKEKCMRIFDKKRELSQSQQSEDEDQA